MSLFKEGDFGLEIREGLVLQKEDWKIVGLLDAVCTIYGDPHKNWRLGLDDRDELTRILSTPKQYLLGEVALVMPKVPGKNGLFTGFDMQVVQIEDDQLSDKHTIDLHHQGIQGFVLSAVFNIHLDRESGFSYPQSGIGNRVLSLRKIIDKYRGSLIKDASPSVQKEWERAAIEIAPYAAAFLDTRTEWDILQAKRQKKQ